MLQNPEQYFFERTVGHVTWESIFERTWSRDLGIPFFNALGHVTWEFHFKRTWSRDLGIPFLNARA